MNAMKSIRKHLHVSLVPGGHELGEADAAADAARQERAEDAAALRNEGNRAARELVHLAPLMPPRGERLP